MKLRPMKDKVLVSRFQSGERKVGSIIIRNDDGKSHGVKSRWGKVYAVGEDINDIEAGQWILVEHGRWSRPHKIEEIIDPDTNEALKLFQVEYPKSVMAVSDEEPADDQFGEFAESYEAPPR